MPSTVTTEDAWLETLRLIPDWKREQKPTVVISPHPDDETLGAGGLIAMQRTQRLPVTLLAVTDGEAAYPCQCDLGEIRRREHQAAAAELGVGSEAIVRFGLRDSGVAESEAKLADLIEAHATADTLLVAPWPCDPHPDHEACGRAARAVARRKGSTLVYYLFWTWHRFAPESVCGLPLQRLHLSPEAQCSRARALACHRSQLERDHGSPILPESLLAPARRSFETFIVHESE